MAIGSGILGATRLKKVDYNKGSFIGVALGKIMNTSHLVIVEPGGRVFLVHDFEDETAENDLIPYTVAVVFTSIASIGSEFRFDHATMSEEFTLEDWVGEIT